MVVGRRGSRRGVFLEFKGLMEGVSCGDWVMKFLGFFFFMNCSRTLGDSRVSF